MMSQSLRDAYARSVVFFDHSGVWRLPDTGLIDALDKRGFQFIDSASTRTPSFVISNYETKQNWLMIEKWNIPHLNRALFVLEPKAVDPRPYSDRFRSKYGLIFFASHNSKRQSQQVGFPWNDGVSTFPLVRVPYIAMIQANKYSSIQGEQYSLRRRVLRELRRRGIHCDLFGPGWENSALQNLFSAVRSDYNRLRFSISAHQHFAASRSRYSALTTRSLHPCGVTSDKFKTLSRYRFSLVIENDTDIFTEKLMDSLASGCITFYSGPTSSVLKYLPGLIILPSSLEGIIQSIVDVLTRAESSLPTSYDIRAAALETFVHPSSKTWKRLGELWLQELQITK